MLVLLFPVSGSPPGPSLILSCLEEIRTISCEKRKETRRDEENKNKKTDRHLATYIPTIIALLARSTSTTFLSSTSSRLPVPYYQGPRPVQHTVLASACGPSSPINSPHFLSLSLSRALARFPITVIKRKNPSLTPLPDDRNSRKTCLGTLHILYEVLYRNGTNPPNLSVRVF